MTKAKRTNRTLLIFAGVIWSAVLIMGASTGFWHVTPKVTINDTVEPQCLEFVDAVGDTDPNMRVCTTPAGHVEFYTGYNGSGTEVKFVGASNSSPATHDTISGGTPWMVLNELWGAGTSLVRPTFPNGLADIAGNVIILGYLGVDTVESFGTAAIGYFLKVKNDTSGLNVWQLMGDGEARWYEHNSPASQYIGLNVPDATDITTTVNFKLPVADGSSGDVLGTDGSGVLSFGSAPSVLALSVYDPEPSRTSESNMHGGLLSLATAQALDSVPTDLVVTKGIGKVMVVVNAGSDVAGDITVTGTSVNRDTGATTGADTDTLTVDATTTDGSDTDTNGNTRHSFTGAYITSKWFTGTVTLSTTNLTLTDVDVFHVSFEQFNDATTIVLDTLDANIYTSNVNAEFDAYLYALEVTGDKCDISRTASLNVGADGETAIAARYWRLRRGALAKTLAGATDGIWLDVHYSNSPAYVEDVSLKVWATVTK